MYTSVVLPPNTVNPESAKIPKNNCFVSSLTQEDHVLASECIWGAAFLNLLQHI